MVLLRERGSAYSLEPLELACCYAALLRLFCLIRSLAESVLRRYSSAITYQKLFEALFVPSDWRPFGPRVWVLLPLLNTGVKAEAEFAETWGREGLAFSVFGWLWAPILSEDSCF